MAAMASSRIMGLPFFAPLPVRLGKGQGRGNKRITGWQAIAHR